MLGSNTQNCLYVCIALEKDRMKRGSEELMNSGCVLKSDVTLVGQFYMSLWIKCLKDCEIDCLNSSGTYIKRSNKSKASFNKLLESFLFCTVRN